MNHILNFLLPRPCCACDSHLYSWEDQICTLCLMQLPISDYHLDPDNPVAEIFWGRVRLEQAGAWFIFLKASRFQKVLHRLKYQHQPKIGIALGKLYAYQLKHSDVFLLPDVIIPVPLHPRRKRKRGYNQSEMIARGMSIALDRPVRTDLLLRTAKSQTQTNKSRTERYENVSGKFKVHKEEEIINKHILLIDDVITTGATIEACAEELLKTEGIKVSIAALAYAAKR